MVTIDDEGYLTRVAVKGVNRNWWMPKWYKSTRLRVVLNTIILPPSYEGKKIRFKVEIIDGGDVA